jgi:hypothetical protein
LHILYSNTFVLKLLLLLCEFLFPL